MSGAAFPAWTPGEAGADHPKYRADIDGLRAVAVLAVMAFHAFPARVTGGFVGVDVFFVISGFLISSIIFSGLRDGRFSFREFYVRRIRRIFPALAIVLVACWAWGWFALFAADYARLGKHIAAGAGFVANFVLWAEAGYFDVASERKPLLHLWSLGVEEQFYLVWPALLYGAWRLRQHLLWVTAAVLIASFAVNVVQVRTDEPAAFYSPVTRFWELLLGATLAYVGVWRGRLTGWLARTTAGVFDVLGGPLRHVAGPVGLACIAAAAVGFDSETSFPGWRAALPVGGSLLVIAAGAHGWINRALLAHPLLVWIGLISYPLYLWHWPLLVFQSMALGGEAGAGAKAGALAASVLLSWLTFRFLERPLRFEWRRATAVGSLAAAMTVALVVGYATYAAEGLYERPVNRSDVAHFLEYYERLHRQGLRGAYRAECDFLDWDTEEPKDAIPADCTAPGATSTVFLWGDSYAQALAAGLRAALPDGARLAQVTTSGCAPRLFEPDPLANRGLCARANGYALARIEALKPDVVVLAQILGHEATDWEALARALRERGAGKVVLAGPAPQWFPTLPEIVTRHHWGEPVDRVGEGLGAENFATDRALADRLASSSAVTYVSLIGALCDDSGCRATVPGTDGRLIAVDSGHLSPEGSRYVVETVLARHLP